MLTGTDQVQILPFDLVHHALHLRKAHNTGNYVAADHVGGNEICKATIDHEVPGIGQNGGMEPGDVTAEIVKAVSAGFPGTVDVDAVELFHDIHMIGDFKLRYKGIPEALHLHIFAVIPADGHCIVNDVGDHQHNLTDPCLQVVFHRLRFAQFLCELRNLRLPGFRFLLLSFCHQPADRLADGFSLVPQCIALDFRLTILPVQFHNLVHQGELFILEFLLDIFLHQFRICPDQLHIDHDFLSCIEFVPRGTILFHTMQTAVLRAFTQSIFLQGLQDRPCHSTPESACPSFCPDPPSPFCPDCCSGSAPSPYSSCPGADPAEAGAPWVLPPAFQWHEPSADRPPPVQRMQAWFPHPQSQPAPWHGRW